MCGFCTPGFIMASVGLLEKHPNPTPEQIRKGSRRQHLPVRHLHAHLRSGVERERGAAWIVALVRKPPAAGRARDDAAGRRPEVCVAGEPRRSGHVRSSGSTVPKRSPAERNTRSTSIVRACSMRRIVRSPHPHARVVVGRFDSGEARAGCSGRARVARSGDDAREQPRDVSGRRSGGRRRRHRRARDRRRTADQGRIRSAAARHPRRAGARRQGAGGLHRRQRASGADAGNRRYRGRFHRRPRTPSKRPTRRRSSRTPAWSRTARSASGTATS